MPDDQNASQNPISEENPSPTSPQESIEQGTENTAHSEPSVAPLDALESSPNDFSVKSNDIPPSNSTPTEAVNEPETLEKQVPNEPNPEPVSEPIESPEPETAQIPVSEPLNSTSEPLGEQVEFPETKTETKPTPEVKPEPVETNPILVSTKPSQKNLWQRFLSKIQIGKRKKLDRVMTLFLKQSKITNDEVEKFLHVSDATATRYLSQLEKEGKIKQVGKIGKAVSYSRI
ncbi:MAG: hypothetical protein WC908_00055 [Candidatus Paceibacterota bacterium]